MHLAYLDDSQQAGSLAMFGAVVIPHGNFGYAEQLHSAAIQQLFPPEEIEEKFKEFHAWELFKGEGAFKGIEQEKRYMAIRLLLEAMRLNAMPFIYAAVDTRKLANSHMAQGLFEVANPLIAAFKLCALGVEAWAQTHHNQPLPAGMLIDYKDQYLFIVDDTADMAIKKSLKNSYRMLRAIRPYIGNFHKNRLWHCHDAMYFGDSTESVGIQLADLCTYFMQRYLMKRDPASRDDGDEFFEMFSPLAICAKPEPEWLQYHEFLMAHDGASPVTVTPESQSLA